MNANDCSNEEKALLECLVGGDDEKSGTPFALQCSNKDKIAKAVGV
jgi:hypothetical protein